MNRSQSCFGPALLAALVGFGTGCALVMDTDFDKYESAPGAAGAGAGGTAGAGGASGQAGAGGSAGGCEPLLSLNEIQTQGSLGPDEEYVELFNASECPAPLEEFVLVYRSSQATFDHGVTWSGEPGQVLAPWSFFVVAGPGFAGAADATFPNGLALGANGGGLAVRKGEDTVDQMGWGDATNDFVEVAPAPAPAENESIGRVPDGKDTNDNLADFVIQSPSPGLPNPT